MWGPEQVYITDPSPPLPPYSKIRAPHSAYAAREIWNVVTVVTETEKICCFGVLDVRANIGPKNQRIDLFFLTWRLESSLYVYQKTFSWYMNFKGPKWTRNTRFEFSSPPTVCVFFRCLKFRPDFFLTLTLLCTLYNQLKFFWRMLILRGLNGLEPKKFEFSSPPTVLAFLQTLNQHFDLIF